MAAFKYIIVKTSYGEWPRLGTKCEEHAVLKREGEKAVAGGFVQFDPELYDSEITGPGFEPRFYCFGESVSLGVRSRGVKDAELIKRCYDLT